MIDSSAHATAYFPGQRRSGCAAAASHGRGNCRSGIPHQLYHPARARAQPAQHAQVRASSFSSCQGRDLLKGTCNTSHTTWARWPPWCLRQWPCTAAFARFVFDGLPRDPRSQRLAVAHPSTGHTAEARVCLNHYHDDLTDMIYAARQRWMF